MSDKFKVIDHVTYERMQETRSRSTSDVKNFKIRNSKYKRMTSSGFNLLQFVVKSKDKKPKIRKRRVIDDRFKPSVKKTKRKQRENGLAEKPSRLKKSILRYRQMKRDQEKRRQEELNKATSELQELTIDHHNETVKPNAVKIHSSRFRDYCDNCTTPALKQHTENLVRELNRFQRRAYSQNEIKARAHRRFVIGFREVQNFLHINKVKLVVIATDCERCDGEAGLDETISNIKMLCHNQQVPIAFPFQRRQLAYFLYKKSSVSCIGILDYDGARDIFVQLSVALKEAKDLYDQLLNNGIS